MNASMTRYLAESLGPPPALVPLPCLGALVHTFVRFISRVVLVPKCFTTTQPTLGQMCTQIHNTQWDTHKYTAHTGTRLQSNKSVHEQSKSVDLDLGTLHRM